MTLAAFCGPPNTAKQPLRPVHHRGVRMPIDTASPVGQGSTCPCTGRRPLARHGCTATRNGGVPVGIVNHLINKLAQATTQAQKYDAVTEGRVGTYRGPQTFGVMQDGTGKAPLTLGDPLLVEQSLALYVR